MRQVLPLDELCCHAVDDRPADAVIGLSGPPPVVDRAIVALARSGLFGDAACSQLPPGCTPPADPRGQTAPEP